MRPTLVLCFVLLALGCGESPPAEEPIPTPKPTPTAGPAATLAEMLAAARAGEWGPYVDTWYGEKDKFNSPDDRDALVKRFEDKWGAKVLPALEAASQVEPRIDGDKALFEKDGNVLFQLYRDAEGNWTFHL